MNNLGFTDFILLGVMGLVLIGFMVFIVQRAVDLFSNDGED